MARNTYYQDEKTAKIDKKKLKSSLRYMLPYKRLIIPLALIMIAVSFIALLPTRVMSYVVDNVLTKKGASVLGVDIDWVWLAVILLGCHFLASTAEAVFTFFRTKYMSKIGHGVVHDMRFAIYNNLQKLAFDYYDSRPNGKILVRATTYLDELANVYSNSVIVILVNALKVLFIIVWLFVIDAVLTLVMLVAIIPMALILVLLRKTINRRRREFREKRSNRTAYIAESIQGHAVINAYNRNDKNGEILQNINNDALKKWNSIFRVNEFINPAMTIFFNVGILAVYWVVFALVTGGTHMLTVGLITTFISFSSQLSQPINEITTQLAETMNAIANLESVMEVIDTKTTIEDKENAEELPPIEGNVKYDRVTFSYDEHAEVLKDVSFEVPKGKTVALVGPTGAGKSTIVNLLTRFYDVTDGSVSVDGHDVREVTLHSLRSQIGVMMQDSFIFSGTIIENIRYGKPDATDEECIEAAKMVSAHDFISKLPDGYYTKTVEQGNMLSTGERQLISFARVVLTNPKILILDEATASIDTHTEELIQKALDVLLKDRTSFVIAHRLSTIKKADCIMYVANKGIAEAGTHEQLMAGRGLYYQLVSSSKNENVID